MALIPSPCSKQPSAPPTKSGGARDIQILKSGVSVWFFSLRQALLKPFQHFTFNPAHPVRAQQYPLRELDCLLQPGYVLR